MVEAYITVEPKNIILEFECETCGRIEHEMVSVIIYDDPPKCVECNITMEFTTSKVLCPDNKNT